MAPNNLCVYTGDWDKFHNLNQDVFHCEQCSLAHVICFERPVMSLL